MPYQQVERILQFLSIQEQYERATVGLPLLLAEWGHALIITMLCADVHV